VCAHAVDIALIARCKRQATNVKYIEQLIAICDRLSSALSSARGSDATLHKPAAFTSEIGRFDQFNLFELDEFFVKAREWGQLSEL
jgi:hypothetical protein